MSYRHKLLIANRGEIAVRIIRTAKSLGIPTVAIYTPSDALSPHVSLADEAVPLTRAVESLKPGQSEGNAYLAAEAILEICKDEKYGVTMVHPGYGFLSENAEFAKIIQEAELIDGRKLTWLGPSHDVIRDMGLKHEARKIAIRAGIPVVPGSDGTLDNVERALEVAKQVGYPMILKATAGGGGMGMVVCDNEGELKERLANTIERAKVHLTFSTFFGGLTREFRCF
jgi:urea carboxylase